MGTSQLPMQSFYFANVSPIVRIPDHDPYKITMMIDAVNWPVAPYIETVEQVVKLSSEATTIEGNKLEAILLKLQRLSA